MRKWILLLTLAFLANTMVLVAQEIPSQPATEQPATEQPASAVAKYEIDAAHSTMGFAVKHLGVSTTRGKFKEFKGTLSYDPQAPESFAADVTIDANSVDTDNENRDNHLRSEDFFATTTYPNITFKNAKLQNKDGKSVIVGDLTIKDITKVIEIPVEISGPIKGMGGGDVIGISGEVTINRQDFNVKFNKTLDAGGMVVSDDVKIIVELEAKAG